MHNTFQIKTFEEYLEVYQNSISEPEKFWADIASHFQWHKTWDNVLEWDFTKPQIKWFEGAQLNITINCLDRHLPEKANRTALIWEPNSPNDSYRTYSYQSLFNEVCRMANVLKLMGIKKGDRVCIYMPMIPDLAFAILACARIGAIHSVIFAGFSANSISDRIIDSHCKHIITADAMSRGAKQIPVKAVVDEAIENIDFIENVLVINHQNWPVIYKENRDISYDILKQKVSVECEAEMMQAEDELFILYTSGSTGKPKGVVHTCGGYMVYTGYTFANVFQYQSKDIYWCTADIGWITGHSYIIYGPLLNAATTLMFEGVPNFPDPGRFWQVIDKHHVNIFYTAPTAIRSLMACGIEHVLPYNLSSLKTLGTVGEPINEEAWQWYFDHIGKGKCPIVDTWWQTETGGILLSALAGISPIKPTHAGLPLPGIQPVLLNSDGNEISENNVEGYLAVKFPWPSMIRTTWGDHDRCRMNYFDTYKGYYFTGDGAKRDENGLYRIIGRVDDVINVSGHRFGTAEIENAINQTPNIVESAVVGFPHDIKGQGIYAFVVVENFTTDIENLKMQIIETIVEKIGRIAKPDKIQIISGLPKTRSGKIMRRILRKITEGEIENLGDTSTLLDPLIVEEIIKGRI